ncbi:hypothetical protein N9L29_05345, partial [Litoricolaceae bacterium]|nr:hypothetical protein [Litorivicinaceae bacterium]
MRSFSWDTTLGLETLDEARAWIVDRVSACAMGGQLDLLSVEIAGEMKIRNPQLLEELHQDLVEP